MIEHNNDSEKLITTLKKLVAENSKPFLNVEEVSTWTGLSKSTIQKWSHKRKLPFYKPDGGIIFYKRKDVENWIFRNRFSPIEEIESQAISTVLKLK